MVTVCDLAIDLFKRQEKGGGHSFGKIKEFMAIELARELATFDVNISSTRNGTFDKCLRAFYRAYNGSACGHNFSMNIPEDLFDLIKLANDNHQNSERFMLLKFR